MTTALAAAAADRSAVLVVSGDVARSWEGLGGFQDASGAAIDDIDVLKPVTGLSVSLSSAAVVAHQLRHAVTHAMARRQPAHLSIPVDVQKASIDADWRPVPEALTGDGCMLMHGMELHTAARERVPLVLAVMNHQAYGNIWYRAHALGPGPERLVEIPGIDWVAFARSMGAVGETVEHPEQIAPAVARALQTDGPYLLDLRIDKTYPTPVGVWRERQAEWEDHE